MIEIRKLGLRRGTFTLKDIDLRIEQGDCLVVVGPSGAGKTLMIESVLGVQPPGTGRILVCGEDITSLPPERRGFAYVPQDLALFPHLGVAQNIAFSQDRKHLPRAEVDRRVREAAGWLGIEHLLHRGSIASLSGGEKQRVAVARALVARPRALFLDEPFSALDAALRPQLYREVRELRRRVRLTTLLVTHDYDEAFVLGDRMAVMQDGRILQVGTPEQVYRCPSSVAVARLLLVENLFRASCLGPGSAPGTALYQLAGLNIQGPARDGAKPGPACWIGVRAHHLRVRPLAAPDSREHANRVEVTLRRVEFRPGRRILEVVPSSAPDCAVQVSLSDSAESVYETGAKMALEIPLEHVLVFDDGAPG